VIAAASAAVPGQAITVNNRGAFFSGSVGQTSLTLGPNRIPGVTPRAQAFILLQELGHNTGVLEHDTGNPEAGKRNDRAIQENCGETLSKFRY